MKKDQKNSDRQEVVKAFSMILQIGLSMIICMAISLGFGIGLDKLFGTRFLTVVMLFIGIGASIRSMLVLTGVYKPGKKDTKEKADGGREENSD